MKTTIRFEDIKDVLPHLSLDTVRIQDYPLESWLNTRYRESSFFGSLLMELRGLYVEGVSKEDIQRVIQAAKEGRIQGRFTSYNPEEREFDIYGHLCNNNPEEARELSQSLLDMFGTVKLTPLDNMIRYVKLGQNPQEAGILKTLIEIMEHFSDAF